MITRELKLVVTNTSDRFESTSFGRDSIIFHSATFKANYLSVECELSGSVFLGVGEDIKVEIQISRPSYFAFLSRNEFEESHFPEFTRKFEDSGYGFAVCSELKSDFLGFQRSNTTYVIGFYDEVLVAESNSIKLSSPFGAIETF